MSEPEIDHCFAPVVAGNTRLLLLGSLPGRMSLDQARYYAHPRNQFWRLVGALIDVDLEALAYEQRLEALRDHHIGLWDVVAAGSRRGSLDADIRLHQTSDLAGLVANLPRLEAIGFNGGTSARIGRRALGDRPGLDLVDLPSSSPAYTLPFANKLEAWRRLAPYVRQKSTT